MVQQTPDVITVAQAETPATPGAEAATEAAHDAAADHTETLAGETHATTEAEGGHEVFPPFDPATFVPQLIWLAITFAILYVVVRNFALPRIGGILTDRQSRIDGDLAAAEASRQRTDAAIAAYESALAAARSRSQSIADETRNAIKADIDARRAGVESDLARRISEAEQSIQVTKGQALGHVDEIAAETAQALVERLIGPVSPQDARDAVAVAARS